MLSIWINDSIVGTLSNLNAGSSYAMWTYSNLSGFAGQTVILKFLGTTDISYPTIFRIDDVSLTYTTLVPPAPNVSADYSTINLKVNETKNIIFALTNSGGVSDHTYLDAMLSDDDGLDITFISKSSMWDYDHVYSNGEAMWKKTDTTSPTLLLHPKTISVWKDADWTSSNSGSMVARITGKTAGTWSVYYRSSMNPKGEVQNNWNPDSFKRDPTSSGYTDATGRYAKRIAVTVTGPVDLVPLTVYRTPSLNKYYVGLNGANSVTINSGVLNKGDGTADNNYLYYYIGTTSSDFSKKIDQDSSGTLLPGDSSNESSAYAFASEDVGTKYFNVEVDATNIIDESDEDNNTASDGPFDVIADNNIDANASSCEAFVDSSKSKSVPNNQWQNFVSNPYFKISGYSDLKSGIAGFSYYFGESDGGSPSTNYPPAITNDEFSTTDPNGNGTYFFRVRTFDKVNNYSAASAPLFTVKYDGTAPNNPTICDAWKTSAKLLSEKITSGSWQTATGNPYLEWIKPTDNGAAGIKGYYYYYGTSDSEEPSIRFTTNNYYNAGVDVTKIPGVYYLRLKTEDNAGNVSASTTIFKVQFDGPPVISDLAAKTDNSGASISQGIWQSDNDPYFYWSTPASGFTIEGYSWAWDTSPEDKIDISLGTNTYYQTPANFLRNGRHVFYIKAKNSSLSEFGSPAQFEILVDTTPPPAVTIVRDGTGEDEDVTTANTRLAANWPPVNDTESGIAKYWYAIGTTPGGNDFKDWLDNGINTSMLLTDLNLHVGTTYYVSVKAENKAGLTGLINVSDGIILIPTQLSSNLRAVDYSEENTEYCSNTALFSWDSAYDADGISGYYYIVDDNAATVPTGATGSFVANNSVAVSVLNDGTWYFHLISKDSLGNVSNQAMHKKIQRRCVVYPSISNIFNLSDGSTLEITTGAITSGATIQIIIPTSTEVPRGIYDPNFIVTTVVKDIRLSNGVNQLNNDIIITLKYTNADVTGLDENTLRIAYYDEGNRIWKIIRDSIPYPSQKSVIARVNHLTLFSIVGVITGDSVICGLTNYPNPFVAGKGGQTKIRYTLKSNSDVRIRIYDLIGELVLEKNIRAGEVGGQQFTNEIPWDGKNSKGHYVAAGGYICIVKVGNKIEKVKIGVK